MRWLLCLLFAAALSSGEPHRDFDVPATIQVVIEYTYVDSKGHAVRTECDIVRVKTVDWVKRHGALDDVDLASLEQLGFIRRSATIYIEPT